jgi:RNA recognition motif-containing protein
MLKTIYISNLPFSVSEERVCDLFPREGTVHSVKLINDRETGKPRGFGFVKMEQRGAYRPFETLTARNLVVANFAG